MMSKKLKVLRKELKTWAYAEFGSIAQRKKDLMENIQILDRKNETEGLTLEEEQLMMNDYNHNFNQVVKEEEIMWRQRSRAG